MKDILSDNNDGSYLSGLGDCQVQFATPSVPAGARMKNVSLRERTYKPAGISGPGIQIHDVAVFAFRDLGYTTVTWESVIEYHHGGVWALNSVPSSPRVSFQFPFGVTRLTEAYLDFTYVAVPVTSVTAPTGTFTDNNLPLVSWSQTRDSDGGAQTRWEVKIFTDAQYLAGGFNPATSTPTLFYSGSGWTGAQTSKQIATALANDTYRAYVRTGQTVNGFAHWSAWSFSGFVVNIVPLDVPNPPTISVTPEDSDHRNKVTVTTVAGAASPDYVVIERSEDGGTTWEDLRTLLGDGVAASSLGANDYYDYEAPNGDTVHYRAKARHDYGGGSVTDSDWSAPGSGAWSQSNIWLLKHPVRPSAKIALDIYSQPEYSFNSRGAPFQALGATEATVVEDTAEADSGFISFLVNTDEERLAFVDLVKEGVSLLVQAPPEGHWEDRWLRFPSNRKFARFVDKMIEEGTIELEWMEVTRPTGNLESWT